MTAGGLPLTAYLSPLIAHPLPLTPYYSPPTGRAGLLPAVVRSHSIHRVRPGRAAHCVIQSTFRTLRPLFS